MAYYGYDSNGIIQIVADKKETIDDHPADYSGSIVEITADMQYPDAMKGQWKHTENGPELVS